MMQYIEKLPIVAVEESSAEEKDGTSESSCVRVLSFKELLMSGARVTYEMSNN